MAMYAADLCTLPASLAGLPAISVRCGLSDGLPVGFQIMAPALADDRCYRVAAALEAAQGGPLIDRLARVEKDRA
jgi:aspartyl-tRNA(Asn)/glutamyl-tRNA(Gln) amidotransferase subunit A